MLFRSNTSERLYLHFIWKRVWPGNNLSIKDTVTGKEVFQLSRRYATPYDVQCDGQHLVAGDVSREVLMLDFIYLHLE